MNAPADLAGTLRGSALFRGLDDVRLARIAPATRQVEAAPGDVLMVQGQPATDLFILLSGEVEVIATPPGGGVAHRLTQLGPGDSFGELALIDRGARSASVRALTRATLLNLPMAALDTLAEGDAGLRERLLGNLARTLAGRLRGVSGLTAGALQRELDLARTRIAMGTFLTYVLLIMVAYGFAMRLVDDHVRTPAETTLVTFPILMGFAVPLLVMMRRSGEPMSTYGLTLAGWRPALGDALVWSALAMAACVAVKAALVHTVPGLAGTPVFWWGGLADPRVPRDAAMFALAMAGAYTVLVPVQEFVARGALQSPLQRFLTGRHATLMAVVLANAMFTASHLHLSAQFALVAMLPGFLWGALYARHRTLVAPVVSHVLVGVWALFVLGFDELLS